MRVAIAGNPNSGKSTLFNRLTGSRARVGNYPGITVERLEAELQLDDERVATMVDLPGCYSLTARSAEEEVAHHLLTGRMGNERPDLVVCVVDATSVERGMYLVVQIMELGLPTLIALNMMDLADRNGMQIDIEGLSDELGAAITPLTARTGKGVSELTTAIGDALATRDQSQDQVDLSQAHPSPASNGSHAAALEAGLDDSQRQQITPIIAALEAAGEPATVAEALWLISSNPASFTYPPPQKVMSAVETVRQRLQNGRLTAFNRSIISKRYSRVETILAKTVNGSQAASGNDGLNAAIASQAAGRQHASPLSRLDHRLDAVLLHPLFGPLSFAIAFFVLFQAVFAWADPVIGGVEELIGLCSEGVAGLIEPGLLRSLISDGLIAGVGNVLVFIPQIGFLFFGIGVLEESGLMSRAAFLLDQVMRRVGLHGKAFIPMMSSFACAVPGVMAARTIESRRDRLVTIAVAPFMSCSARLPVYAMVIAAVFSTAEPVFGVLSVGGLVMTAMYALGFAAALITALLLKKTVWRSPTLPLILELPPYRLPQWRNLLNGVFRRCRVFVVQTGRIIVVLSVMLWVLLTFPRVDGGPGQAAAVGSPTATAQTAVVTSAGDNDSALSRTWAGRLGKFIEPAIEPLGFDWRIGIGIIASFAAREVLVSTMGQVYSLDEEIEPDSPALRDALLADIDPQTGRPRFSPLCGVSLMVFFVLAMQCLSTVAAVKRETGSWRLPIFQWLYMNGVAYLCSLLVFQGGRLLGFE